MKGNLMRLPFTSDHGLSVGQHGLMGKQNLFDHSVRVPLIMAGPGIPAGHRVDRMLYHGGLFATTCDLADIPVPRTVEKGSFRRSGDRAASPGSTAARLRGLFKLSTFRQDGTI